MKKAASIFWVCLGLLLLLFTAACGPEENFSGDSPDPSYTGDPLFQSYYDSLGGQQTLGAFISDVIQKDGLDCQYTENALLCHDPQERTTRGFALYPLGRELQISDIRDSNSDIIDFQSKPAGAAAQPTNGFWVYNPFVEAAQNFGAGMPLSRFIRDNKNQQIQQWFEAVGFYTLFDDPTQKVYLLPYGRMACKAECGPGTLVPDLAIPQLRSANPILEQLDNLQDARVLGRQLTDMYQAPDGYQQVVFENAVVFLDPVSNRIALRPLSQLLSLDSHLPGPQKYNRKDGMIFYKVSNDDRGYHVPIEIDDFLNKNISGQDLAGKPISGAYPVSDTIARQNFENVAVEYHRNGPEGNRVRLAPIGRQYLEKFGQPTAPSEPPAPQPEAEPPAETPTEPQPAEPPQELPLVPAPQEPQLAEPSESGASGQLGFIFKTVNQIQEGEDFKVYLLVYDNMNLRPAKGVRAHIELNVSGKTSTYDYKFQATNSYGWAAVVVPPLPDATHNDVVIYKICVESPAGESSCQENDFLVWNPR